MKQMACSSTGLLSTVPTTVRFILFLSTGIGYIATRSNVYELDIIAPCFKSFANAESLAWQILQVKQVSTPPLTSSYPGQTQSCPFVNVLSLIIIFPRMDPTCTIHFSAVFGTRTIRGCSLIGNAVYYCAFSTF